MQPVRITMNRHTGRLAVLCFSTLCSWASGLSLAASSLGCLIEPERVAELGSPVMGVIESVRVDRGDIVLAGQTLAVLRADVERATLQVAETRSRLEADVAAAEANRQLAQQKLSRSKQLHAVNFISSQALEQAVAEHEVAAQKLAQTKEQMKVWGKELGVAQAQVGLRTVRSPFVGVVVERYTNPGERIEEKPILKVAMIDPLRVELLLPVAHYGQIVPGTALTVTPDLPHASPVSAKVTRVDKVVDAASNTFRVRLALPNPGNKLPAGLRCKVNLQLPAAAADAKAQSTHTQTPKDNLVGTRVQPAAFKSGHR
jgi:membrane fusion protein, heavy metal efflux system